jgi:hypothetical protein
MGKKLLNFLFLLILFSGIIFVLKNFVFPVLLPNNGTLSVSTPFQSSTVYLDNKKLGATPFYASNLRVGDHTVKIESEGSSWESKISLATGTYSSVELNLAKADSFNSGESLFFRKDGKGLVVLSKPEGAQVIWNGQDKGKTPLKFEPEGGVASLVVKKDGYLSRELSPNIVSDFRLTTTVFLSVDPFGTIKKLDSNAKISLFSLHNNFVKLSSYQDWAEGVSVTQRQFSGSQTRFDVLIDPDGKLHVLNKTEWENKLKSKAVANVGYLATKENDTLSEKAASQWASLKAQFN